ncbi:MAG: PA0069 family radical SAM protein [Gammaproteobacteria bacterium]
MTDDLRRTEKGRGATLNLEGRFAKDARTRDDDGWGVLDEPLPALETVVQADAARTIISRNDSPDVGFSASVNPYRGCESGCIYCFARPTHAYMDLSPGLDFETKLFYKPHAAALLRDTFRKPGYEPAPIALGINTDGYQPIERKYGITRACLEVMTEFRHPVAIVTKHSLVTRDLDLLVDLARDDLVKVMFSVTSLDPEIKRTLEPRAAGPAARLRAMRMLSEAGVPTGVMVAPVIPAVTDHELEHILASAADAGARSAGYVMLRLPYEVKHLFRAWLDENYPQRAAHVMSLVNQMRGGKDNDARFGSRMRGEGPFAELIRARFQAACRKHGLNHATRLRTDRFCVPAQAGDQLGLFGS